ncbi:MFS transporter, partial [Streptomyces varsoviensis]
MTTTTSRGASPLPPTAQTPSASPESAASVPSPGPGSGLDSGSGPGSGQTAAAPPVLTTLGLLTVLLGAALPMIDFFIVNVALPTIDRDLNAGPAMLEMVVGGYGVAYAVLLVLGGRLGDMIGRRRLFLWGTVAFGVTSVACGLAPDAWTLVALSLIHIS